MGSSSPVAVDSDPPTAKMATLDLSKVEKFARRNGDALFGYIEQCQAASSSDGTARFGRFLDAGTGSHSLGWIASLVHREHLLEHTDHGESSAPRATLTSYTAVTADETMRRRVVDAATALGVEGAGDVIVGNWQAGAEADGSGGADAALLEGRTYDTILADYLVGAIDGFAPYFQDQVFRRLRPHLAPGGRLYVVGLQPIPDSVPGDADIFCKITKARDACILLAGHRCYREYPLDWIKRHVEGAGMTVVESRQYPIRYDQFTLTRQINVGRSKLKLFSSKGMAREMGKVLDDLEKESAKVIKRQSDGRVTLGFDYVVVAERPKE